MTTFEMLSKSIDAKKARGALTKMYITNTKSKMDVFLMNDRITEDEYNQLTSLMDAA